MRRIALAILAFACTPALAQISDAEVYTLYRNSVVDATMRLHVATFDSTDGKDYNAENCFLASQLFQDQGGVQVRFWCEPGRYSE